jgi:uncharacterized protein (DUF1778 family)
MADTDPKHELIQVRVSLRQKRTIEAAARHRGQTLSDLVREGADALVRQVAA